MKILVLENSNVGITLMDREMTTELAQELAQSEAEGAGRPVRWKLLDCRTKQVIARGRTRRRREDEKTTAVP